jgi:polyhydroxybutyrate depolymerase
MSTRRKTRIAFGIVALAAVASAGLGVRRATGTEASGEQARTATNTTAAPAAPTDAPTPVAPGPATATTTAPKTTTTTTLPSTMPPPQWVTTTVDMTYDGLPRYYLVTRPGRPTSEALPVVIALHGSGATPAEEETRMDFPSVAGPAVLVYPAGYQLSWNAGVCCQAAQVADINDVGFLTAVVHAVLGTLPAASAAKVYLAGYSNGAKMAYRLACADPGLFQAVAVYGATPVAACPDLPPTSLLEMASTGDPELTIGPGGTPQVDEGFVEPTVVGEADAYRTADACGAAAATSTEGTLTSTTWTCPGGRTVTLALYAGGTHAWQYGSGATPSGEEVMWQFFLKAGAGT